jgi:predicted GNAT superfamily acetyltransferase
LFFEEKLEKNEEIPFFPFLFFLYLLKKKKKKMPILLYLKRVQSFLYIDRIVIDPQAQHRGIGTKLYEHILSQVTDLPVVCEVKISPECNDGSIKFHEKFGFKEMGLFSGDGIKTCRMYIRE